MNPIAHPGWTGRYSWAFQETTGMCDIALGMQEHNLEAFAASVNASFTFAIINGSATRTSTLAEAC
jgi:hypothetical protein